jgi:hypothetical protein
LETIIDENYTMNSTKPFLLKGKKIIKKKKIPPSSENKNKNNF